MITAPIELIARIAPPIERQPERAAAAGSPSPRCCPTRVAAAAPKPSPGRNENARICAPTLYAATASVPYGASRRMKNQSPAWNRIPSIAAG